MTICCVNPRCLFLSSQRSKIQTHTVFTVLRTDTGEHLLLDPHLSDGLAAIRVDPEGSRLDRFLGVYLGDGPLHLIHHPPAGCGVRPHTHKQTHTDRERERNTGRVFLSFCVHYRQRAAYTQSVPPHLMSCPGRAAWLELRRWHSSTHDVSSRAAPLILHLHVTRQIFFTSSRASEPPLSPLDHHEAETSTIWRQTRNSSTFHSTYEFPAVFVAATVTLLHAVPSHLVKCGDVATALWTRMRSCFRQRPLVAGKILQQRHLLSSRVASLSTAEGSIPLYLRAFLCCCLMYRRKIYSCNPGHLKSICFSYLYNTLLLNPLWKLAVSVRSISLFQ